jgi:ribosome biogenesis GTPase
MAAGNLTKKLDRGRHTTRHSELFSVGDGLVIDSPGFSLFELTDLLPSELPLYYPELSDPVSECRFMDCSHTGEPGCCVTELLEKGYFDSGRYERYKSIYKDLKEKEKNKYK